MELKNKGHRKFLFGEKFPVEREIGIKLLLQKVPTS